MKSSPHNTHFSHVGQSHGVVRAAGHLSDDLIQQVGRHQHRGHLLIGCPDSQLAVTVMTPGKNCSIWATKTLLVSAQIHFTQSTKGRVKGGLRTNLQWPAVHWVHCRSSGWPPSSRWRSPAFWARWCSGSLPFPDSCYSWVQRQTPSRGGGEEGVRKGNI